MIRERIVQWADHFIRLPVVGLDISDRSIKYVKFSAGRSGQIESFGEKEIDEGVIVEGRIERPADFVSVLRALSSLLGRWWSPMGVVASLPEEKSFLRLVQLPDVKPAEVAGALRWQIEGQIPLPAEDLAYDYEIIESLVSRPEHLDVVITAYPKTIVDAYISALKEGGFQPVALELESQAIARAVLGGERAPDATAVVDMGRNRTTIAMCAAGSVIFTATVPVGGRMLEQEIAKALGVDMAAADRLKKEHGLIPGAYEGKIFRAILPTMEMITGELGRTIAYYEDHISHIHGGTPEVRRVLMCGGDANLFGLDTYLSSRVRVPVSIADPFYGIAAESPYPIPEIPRREAVAFAAAIGLARRITA
ncbi:MAG: hypothetical protein A3B34_01505 [Candidatus Sungbacteria bacterium RIFCSPLOWO2_01_FULL_54_21]|uniref:SHS2 domain-containing protein n=1 Tax=Candidatus Sungbacteria bacterium RIFCSPLOWO2_01_FULL_54_21 TaxID=1802279 RepID=A0A1G2L4D6_9BACT|nr:MAG: hypothetical protein A3B34_01505 [Candidatus Sungbacteria bacterium RIFCSPLOWO2_01_FULL_54_21]